MELAQQVAEQVSATPVAKAVYAGHLALEDFMSTEHNMIPHMEFERKLSAAAGLSIDQLRVTLALFASVLLMAGIRLFSNATARHLYALVTGVLIVYYPFGSGIIHALPMAICAYLALLVAPRRAGTIAWCTVFPYLIYLHVVNASGESWKSGNMDFTGGAMVAVLKLLALCTARQDSFKKNKEDLSPYQAAHQLPYTPSPLAFMSYLFGMGNLLAGPFYEFTDYKQFIELKGPWDPKAPRRMPPVLGHGLLALLEGLWHMGVYLGLTLNGWSMEHYHSAWYYSQPLGIRCLAVCVIGLVYQLRYYFSWKVVESGYVFSGLDFVGWDAATNKPTWGRCRNCSFLGVWLADSARNVPLNWNIATGTFLRRYVYERIAPRGRKPGFQSLLFTQLVSAVWHGLYAGYMLFFAGTAVWIYFSQILYKAETHLPGALVRSLPYRAVKIAWTTLVLNYMACAFQLLDYKASMAAYASLHYFPFIVMFVCNVLGSFVRAKRSGSKGPKDGKGASTSATNGHAATANGHAKAQ